MKRRVFIGGGVLLLLLLALSGRYAAREYYAEQISAKVWPQTPLSIPLSAVVLPETNTLLFLGDSRAAEWGVPIVPGWRVLNAGIPGITTAELTSFSGPLLDQVRPQVVVLQAGINTLKLLGVRPGLREELVAGCVSNLLMVVQQARGVGARVIVTPVWPVGKIPPSRWVIWSGAVRPAVVEANAQLKSAVAGMDGVEWLDVLEQFAPGEGTAQREWYRDALHLKPEAYAGLTRLVVEHLPTTTEKILP